MCIFCWLFDVWEIVIDIAIENAWPLVGFIILLFQAWQPWSRSKWVTRCSLFNFWWEFSLWWFPYFYTHSILLNLCKLSKIILSDDWATENCRYDLMSHIDHDFSWVYALLSLKSLCFYEKCLTFCISLFWCTFLQTFVTGDFSERNLWFFFFFMCEYFVCKLHFDCNKRIIIYPEIETFSLHKGR